ncbi:Retrotrans gag domain-containing protein [Abeliophyllum distichum]|uniref:Retrotrans gag domain-containing protein n=1 Tax=Abeliophyllum distichum TaxID=126358 RepID=A0ABD1V7A7_9LAMI
MDDNNRVRDPPLVDVRNNFVPMVRPVEVNERVILMGEYMMPLIVENQSSIIYPPYGHDNFQLRPDVINLFSNNLQFYGKTDKNPHYHISRFIEYCENFKHHGVNKEALRMRLFPHTLKDKAREWLDSLPSGSITTWTDLIQKFTRKYFPSAKVNKLKHKIKISNFQKSDFGKFLRGLGKIQETTPKMSKSRFFFRGS